MTPILKFDSHEKDEKSMREGGYNIYDGSIESVLVSKVARLTNDGSNLGPGAYNIDSSSKALAQSPKGAITWQNSKSKRTEHFVKKFTQTEVGPGAYQLDKKPFMDRSIYNPTIPRAANASRTHVDFGFKQKKGVRNKGSIRSNFEEDSDEEHKVESPGPG